MVEEEELAQLIVLAWDGEPESNSGPRRTLTVARIVEEAIRLADEGGLGAASMPKLAQALGVGTMSLYRYVPSKTVLTQLMLDRATEAPPVGGAGTDWRESLTTYAQSALDRYAAHPWMLDVPVLGFPQTPRVLAWLEYGLAALSRAGFGEQDQLGSMLLLDGHVAATARIRRSAQLVAAASEPRLDRLAPDAYPQLATLVRTGAFTDDEFGDYGYRFGLERILDSIQHLDHA